MKKRILTTALLGATTALTAETLSPAWTGEAELGMVATSGNTDTQSINFKGKAVNEREKWKHTGKLEALNTADSDTTTAERYFLSGKSNYKLSEFRYVYGIVSYEADRFSGYDYRISESVGYGVRVIRRATLTLDLELGPGARQSKLDNGDKDNEFIARALGDLTWKISPTSSFGEELSTEIGEDAAVTKSITSLKTQINGSFAMKASLTVKHTSSVPTDVDKTDTETAVTLVYSF